MNKRCIKNIIKGTLIGQLGLRIKFNAFHRKWIRKNRHNQTIPMNPFPMDNVEVDSSNVNQLVGVMPRKE